MSIFSSLVSLPLIFPLTLLGGGAFGLMLLELFSSKWANQLWFWMVFGLLGAAWWGVSLESLTQGRWLQMDLLAQFSTQLLLASGALALISGACASKEQGIFLLSLLFGWILFANAADFLSLFLGLQTVSVALYLWCATSQRESKERAQAREAAFKYLALGAIGAGCLLYGIALQYWAVGTTEMALVLERALHPDFAEKPIWITGALLVGAGISFKAALFPFQFWAPDVYAGVSLPLVGLMVTGMKVAVFVFSFRFFGEIAQTYPSIASSFVWIAIFTLIWAHLGALREKNLQRFLAYSGMVHAAWLWIPVVSSHSLEREWGLLFYLLVYVLANGALVLFWERAQKGWESAPGAVFMVSFAFMTLAGLPPTPGFFAKFYLIQLAYESHWNSFWLVALLTAILSTFYYLRWIFQLFRPDVPPCAIPIPSKN